MAWRAGFLGIAVGLIFPAIVAAQNQPLPKPVSPSSPDQASPPPVGAKPPVPGNILSPAGTGDIVLSPFLDSQTIGVIRVDLTDIDLPATRDWVVQSVCNLRKANKEVVGAEENVHQEITEAADGVDKFRSAGVGRMYVVISLADLMENRLPFLVVPLRKDPDANAVERALLAVVKAADVPLEDSAQPIVRKIGQTVILAAPATINRLKAAAPAKHPDLVSAFDAAGQGQIRLGLVPQQGARKVVENLISALPDELGDGPIQIVSRGMRWMSVAIAFPPSPSLKIVVQAADLHAATKLDDVVSRAIAWCGQRKEGPQEALAFNQMLGRLKPLLQDDRITIELSGAELGKFAGSMADDLIRSRDEAYRVVVRAKLGTLAAATDVYANLNNGAMPESLADVLQHIPDPNVEQVWEDPFHPKERMCFIYLKLADKLTDVKQPASAVLIYEKHKTWGDGINVAFADRHCEWISDEKQFNAMLKATKQNNPKAVEMPQ